MNSPLLFAIKAGYRHICANNVISSQLVLTHTGESKQANTVEKTCKQHLLWEERLTYKFVKVFN